jgi:hypothetical protein
VEYALAVRLVTRDDLALLDRHTGTCTDGADRADDRRAARRVIGGHDHGGVRGA